ncbi:effector-associated constant component EACC1 [Streptomyces chrestomyceticus]|uniref:effector-associated constant component EACC1 n=1 Tax=Streptomyces chrestomyceticus TaxID=68185 RepID=UPI0035A8B349
MEHGASDLRSLHAWLRSDAVVRRSATLELQDASLQPGHMGSAVEVIKLVTENGWSAASFVMAVVAWKRTRPQNPDITISRDGTTVSLMNCSDEEVESVIRMLSERQDGEGAGE